MANVAIKHKQGHCSIIIQQPNNQHVLLAPSSYICHISLACQANFCQVLSPCVLRCEKHIFFSTACFFASHSGISCIGANLSTSFDSDHVGGAHINYAWKPNENWHQWASKLPVLRGTRNKNKWNADVLFQHSCAALIYQPNSFMKQLSEKKKQWRKRVNAYVTV